MTDQNYSRVCLVLTTSLLNRIKALAAKQAAVSQSPTNVSATTRSLILRGLDCEKENPQ